MVAEAADSGRKRTSFQPYGRKASGRGDDGKDEICFLGHLSEENNNPHLAYETVEEILRNNRIEVGTHVKMDMASRFQNGVKVEL